MCWIYWRKGKKRDIIKLVTLGEGVRHNVEPLKFHIIVKVVFICQNQFTESVL